MSYSHEMRTELYRREKKIVEDEKALWERQAILEQASIDGIRGVKERVDYISTTLSEIGRAGPVRLSSTNTRFWGWGDVVCEVRNPQSTDDTMSIVTYFSPSQTPGEHILDTRTFMRIPSLDSGSEFQLANDAFASFHDAPGEIQEYVVHCLVPAEKLCLELLADNSDTLQPCA